MKLKIEQRKFSIAVDYLGETTKIEMSPLNPEAMDKLFRRHKNRKKDDFDVLNFKIEKLQKSVVDWDIVDEDTGEKLPCTPENIKLVFLTHPTLLNKASERADRLFVDEEEADDDELGSSFDT